MGASLETLATCVALIEIVNSCNLNCPTCFADSPVGTGRELEAVALDDLKRRIQGVVDRKGRIGALQLSGGEPTLHPRLFDLLEWAQEHPGIDFVLLNTNGVRIASDAGFARQLAATFRDGKMQVYLQFDGPDLAGQRILRGADLRAVRRRAIEQCAHLQLPVTLAMTVIPENLAQVWATIEFGLQYANIRGVTFQPMFAGGRVPSQTRGQSTLPARLGTADVVLAAVEHSAGRLRYEDFTPLPCGDPNCATIGYLLRLGTETRSLGDFLDFTQVQDFLRDRLNYSPENLRQLGQQPDPLGKLIERLGLDETHTFRLLIKPFMDAWTWDEDRIASCCTHVIRPDGQLDSFCRYYSR